MCRRLTVFTLPVTLLRQQLWRLVRDDLEKRMQAHGVVGANVVQLYDAVAEFPQHVIQQQTL